MRTRKRRRLDELQLARALEGLDAGDAAELEARLELDGEPPGPGYEEAAAWFWLGAGDAPRDMPPRVAARLQRRLQALAATRAETPPLKPPDRGRGARRPREGQFVPPERPGPASLAVVMVLAFAFAGWWPNGDADPGPGADALAAARAELMASAPDAMRVEWEPADPNAPARISGHVVWSDQRQRGFVTLRDVPANDPAQYRYHVWVYDIGGGGFAPVRGGAFNAPEDGEVIIRIENEQPIARAGRFAVTREPADRGTFTDTDTPLLLAQPATASGT